MIPLTGSICGIVSPWWTRFGIIRNLWSRCRCCRFAGIAPWMCGCSPLCTVLCQNERFITVTTVSLLICFMPCSWTSTRRLLCRWGRRWHRFSLFIPFILSVYSSLKYQLKTLEELIHFQPRQSPFSHTGLHCHQKLWIIASFSSGSFWNLDWKLPRSTLCASISVLDPGRSKCKGLQIEMGNTRKDWI